MKFLIVAVCALAIYSAEARTLRKVVLKENELGGVTVEELGGVTVEDFDVTVEDFDVTVEDFGGVTVEDLGGVTVEDFGGVTVEDFGVEEFGKEKKKCDHNKCQRRCNKQNKDGTCTQDQKCKCVHRMTYF